MKQAVLILFDENGDVNGVYLSESHVVALDKMNTLKQAGIPCQIWAVSDIADCKIVPRPTQQKLEGI